MLNHLPFGLIAASRAMQTEMRSALPGAPVVAEAARTEPRTYRTRAALATRLAGIADVVAPKGWAPSHGAATTR